MAQIRIGHSLSNGEKKHINGRKYSVKQCLAKHKIPCDLDEVPNIAFLGSGGGERAMVGMLGSLYQLGKQELMDTALYLSGVSGSTWCMSSVYEKPNWSLDIEQLKEIKDRLAHGSVGLQDRINLLVKYYKNHDNFSLTDAWAALVVPTIVHKIDESTLSNYQGSREKDPYPIYTVINQDSKYKKLANESFFELTPHEAGYSTAGAFVETSSFGSQFHKGHLIKKTPEMDMTYLQGVCGSALADKEVILKVLKDWLENGTNMKAMKGEAGLRILGTVVDLSLARASGTDLTPILETANKLLTESELFQDYVVLSKAAGRISIDEQAQLLTSYVCKSFFQDYKHLEGEELVVFVKTLQNVNEKTPKEFIDGLPPRGANSSDDNEEQLLESLIHNVKIEAGKIDTRHDGPSLILQMLELTHRIVKGEEWTHLVEDLNKLLKGKKNLGGEDLRIIKEEWDSAGPQFRKKLALNHTLLICKSFFSWFSDLKNAIWDWIVKKILKIVEWMLDLLWIWGKSYNYLHDIKAPEINKQLLAEPIQHFEDAGLLDNSPYISTLRSERKTDLIISFDFSEGNPMETLTKTEEICKELNIHFPRIHFPEEEIEKPKSFYVFSENGAPTVIHIPLFNIENCGDKLSWYRNKYTTFQGPYSPEMIDDLMEKSGENVINNKTKLLKVIENMVEQKRGAAV